MPMKWLAVELQHEFAQAVACTGRCLASRSPKQRSSLLCASKGSPIAEIASDYGTTPPATEIGRR